MAGKFTFTYKGLSDTIQKPLLGPIPTVVPVLESFDLFPTRIWQSHLEPLVPHPGVIHGSVKGGVPNGHADVHLTPSAGLLVLFPCWMDHYVEPHDSDEPRITIAFNALDSAPSVKG
jgi:Putative 2OG-Fe(II) oxygenase